MPRLALAAVLAAAPLVANARTEPAAPATSPATDDAELAALRRAEAELPAGPKGDEARERLLLDIGRAERRVYDATSDAEHLSAAQAALRQHLELAARRGTLTAAHRQEVEAELTALDNLAGWETAEPASPAPPPIPVVAPPALGVPPPSAAPPAPSKLDPVLDRRRKAAEGVAIAGATFMGIGGAAWLLLAVPAAIAAAVAEDRAADDPFLVSETELHNRADRRRRFARITFWSGLGGVVVGGALLGAGLGSKAKIEREMSRPRATLHVVPTLGWQGAGATLVLRHR